MRIAVIGTGNIGGTLGSKWRAVGQDVVYGSRHPSGTGPGGAPVLGVAEALNGADAVLLAVPGGVVPDVVSTLGAALDGTVVIDAANRIGEPETSSHTLIVAATPAARYVRAFNTLGWENFADPLPGTDLFSAADPGARAAAEELADHASRRRWRRARSAHSQAPPAMPDVTTSGRRAWVQAGDRR